MDKYQRNAPTISHCHLPARMPTAITTIITVDFPTKCHHPQFTCPESTATLDHPSHPLHTLRVSCLAGGATGRSRPSGVGIYTRPHARTRTHRPNHPNMHGIPSFRSVFAWHSNRLHRSYTTDGPAALDCTSRPGNCDDRDVPWNRVSPNICARELRDVCQCSRNGIAMHHNRTRTHT